MVNAWSLAYDVINGTLDENFPPMTDNTITSLESDEYDPKPKSDKEDTDWKDPVITVGSGNTASMGDFVNFDLTDQIDTITIDTSNHETIDFSTLELSDAMTVNWDLDPDLAYMEPGTVLKTNTDTVSFASTASTDTDLFASMDGVNIGIDTGSIYADTWPHAESLNIKMPDDYPTAFTTLSDNDDAIAHHVTTPGIESNNPRKYKEDESIKALQDYISTTYNGHYTSKENNVQTLDLIESVGDAESFCRSNAIKYLSRYDKKGQAKRDILKALHYSLLLYHFSGQLNETPTRGYETF